MSDTESSESKTSSDSEDDRINDLVQSSPLRRVVLKPPRFTPNIMATPEGQEQPNVAQGQDQDLQLFDGYPRGFHMSILNEIPRFEGNPAELSEYVRAVEDIFTQFWQTRQPGAYINKLLLSAARNRLKGAALEIITGYHYDSWDELKEVLISNFGDQRSELNIQIDLTRLRQSPKQTPVNFFNQVRSLLAILNSKIALGNETPDIKKYKLLAAKNLALKAYTSGLLEPLGSFIRSRAPGSLEQAITYVKDEIDIRYFQGLAKTHPSNIHPQHKFSTIPNQSGTPMRANSSFQNYQQPRYNQQNYFPNHGPSQFKPNFTPTHQLNPNQPPAQFPGFQKPFAKPGQNAFAPRRNFQHTNQPEPMQTSTINKRPASQQIQKPNPSRPFNPNFKPNNYIQQSSQPRNFHSQELFNVEFNETPTFQETNYEQEPTEIPEMLYQDDYELEQEASDQFPEYYENPYEYQEDAANFH